MDELLRYFNTIYPLSAELSTYMTTMLKYREFRKKDFLLKQGRVSNHIYFIGKGLLRCYYLKNSTEVCSWFMKEGDLCVSVESFFKQTSSYENIQAIEDCIVYFMDYKDVQFMYRNFPESNFIGRVLTELYYTLSEQLLYSLRMQKAADRYFFIMQNHQELIQRVPSKYLASYLGISEETLSRIRGGKMNKLINVKLQ